MNSLLTIAAEGDTTTGLGFLRRRYPACPLPYSCSDTDSGRTECTIWVAPWNPQFNMFIEYSPLENRGWILQERFFPSRILHFTPWATLWECRTQTACETKPDEAERKRAHSEGFAEIWHTKNTYSQLLPLKQQTDVPKEKHYDTWRWIVEAYTRTILTVGSDRLPAISGMANHFQSILGEKYYAGLWEGDVVRGLCWDPKPDRELKKPKEGMYQAPSWSWASLDSAVRFINKGDGDWRSRIEVIGVDVVPKGANAMGEVAKGELRIKGKMLNCGVHKIQSKPGFVDIVLGGKQVNMMPIEDEGMKDEVWCLWVMEDVGKPNTRLDVQPVLPHGRLLLLDEVSGRKNTFRRVGVIMYGSGLPQWKVTESRNVTLV